LKAISAREPENSLLAWEALSREVRLARLLAVTGDEAVASRILTASAPRMQEIAGMGEAPGQFSEIDIEMFEVDHARLLIHRGEVDKGGFQLRAATARLAELTAEKPDFRDAVYALAIAYFEYWQHFGESPGDAVEPLLEPVELGLNDVMSCHDASVAAQLSVAQGDLSRAEKLVDYALQKGYFEPGFVAFCRRYALCEGR
jgi:hypothetical protein